MPGRIIWSLIYLPEKEILDQPCDTILLIFQTGICFWAPCRYQITQTELCASDQL